MTTSDQSIHSSSTRAGQLGRLGRLGRLFGLSLLLLLGMTSSAWAFPGVVTPVAFPSAGASNPGDLSMYEYVPVSGMGGARPLVVVLPGCGQAASSYAVQSGWTKIAEARGLYLVIAEQKLTNNGQGCFNWFEPTEIGRTGGEAESIAQMVSNFSATHAVDASKVVVAGLSAGGSMAAVMLAVYGDVFSGGVIAAGVPYGCATGPATANRCMGTPGWAPMPARTPAQWSALVAAAAPAGASAPNVMILHGSADTVVTQARMLELRDQWADYAGLSTTAGSVAFPKGYPETTYSAPGVTARVQTVELTGMGHGVSIDAGWVPFGGADKCGFPGPYVLNVGLCTSYYAANFLGL